MGMALEERPKSAKTLRLNSCKSVSTFTQFGYLGGLDLPETGARSSSSSSQHTRCHSASFFIACFLSYNRVLQKSQEHK